MEISEKRDPYSSLRIGDFRLFLSFRFLMTVALQMQMTVISWKVYAMTGDKLSLGLIGLAEAIPYLILALFGGHIADLFNRKKIIVWSLIVLIIGSVSLFIFTLPGVAVLENFGVLPIYANIVLLGIVRGFVAPAQNAFFGQILPRAEFTNGATWNSNVWQFAAVAGPAIGGLVYGIVNIETALGSVVVLLILSLFLTLMIKTNGQPEPREREPLAASLTTGLRFVFKHQIILGALSLDLFAVLFGGAMAMIPAFAVVLGVGPEGAGFMRAAPFFGSVISGIILAYKPPVRSSGRKLLLAVTGFGLATIAFALSKDFYLSLFFLFIAGAFDNVSVVIRHTIIQLMTPDEMRGRVSSVNGIFIGSSNEIGAFESGMAASIMGLVPSVIFGGCMTLVVVSIAYLKAPLLRKFSISKMEKS